MSAVSPFRVLRWSRLIDRWPAVRSQRRAAFVAILRAVEVFCFAPIAGNHRRRKANHFSAQKPQKSFYAWCAFLWLTLLTKPHQEASQNVARSRVVLNETVW